MLPIIEVPESVHQGMKTFRPVFCREEGWEHISRYVTGLLGFPVACLAACCRDENRSSPDGELSR